MGEMLGGRMKWIKRLLCRILGHKWKFIGLTYPFGDVVSQCKRCGIYKLNDIEKSMTRQSTKLWATFLAWLTNGEISEEESEKKLNEMMEDNTDSNYET